MLHIRNSMHGMRTHAHAARAPVRVRVSARARARYVRSCPSSRCAIGMRGGRWGGRGGRGGSSGRSGQPRSRGSRGSRGSHGWSRGGIACTISAVPVVDLRLEHESTPDEAGERQTGAVDFSVISHDHKSQMFKPCESEPWAAVQPEPESDSSSTPGLDPDAPAYVAALNPQAAEFQHHNPSAGQHLMSMLGSSAPRDRVLPGPPDIGQQSHPQAARALRAPLPRRVVYRALDESDRRAVKCALAHHLDPGELLTSPCVNALLRTVFAAAAAAAAAA
jgi:hypothetical protein